MSLVEVAGSAEKKKIYRINTGNVYAFPSVFSASLAQRAREKSFGFRVWIGYETFPMIATLGFEAIKDQRHHVL